MTTLTNEEIHENEARRQRAAPELARHARQRRNQKEASGVSNKVNRTRGKSVRQAAAAAHEVDRGPVKRWRRANALAQVPTLAGYHIEWVRKDNQFKGDNANLLAHLEEYWEPCRREDFPGRILPTQALAEFGAVIGNASNILMKIPDELKAQRDRHYNNIRDNATAAISKPNPAPDGVSHQSMPIVEDVVRHTQTAQRSRARRPQVRPADDQ